MSLSDRLERQTLYVLSHLEMQNSNKQLIFSYDGVERLNACIQELDKAKPHQKLFVWEPDSSDKRNESNQQLMMIIAIVMMLLLANYYRWLYNFNYGLKIN